MGPPGAIRVRRLATGELSAHQVAEIRRILWAAFNRGPKDERFTEDDWRHALGWMHFLLEVDTRISAHAAVVPRDIRVAGAAIHTGYVEAVATDPARQAQGLGTVLMRDVGRYLDDHFELGLLGTGSHHFYERLGWQTWRGPSSVRAADGTELPTPADDGYLMCLRTTSSPPGLDLDAPISCEWRAGDFW